MSTGTKNINQKKTAVSMRRFAELAKRREMVFYARDLANLWGITDANNLYTTLKRYVQQGLLLRVRKGLYALKPLSEIDPLLLGIKALHSYTYISCETILQEKGIIQQVVPYITLVSAHSKRFTIAGRAYYSRQLSDRFLFNSSGIELSQFGVKKATMERAVADMLYFNPRAHFDAIARINWDSVRQVQQTIGYPLYPTLRSG